MNNAIETITIPTQDSIKTEPRVMAVIQTMSAVKAELAALKIKDEVSAQLASNLIAKGKKGLKDWEALRKEAVEPFNAAVKAINGFFNPAKTAADKLFTDTQKSVLLVMHKLEIDRKKEQEKLLKEQQKINVEREKAGLDAVDMVPKKTEAPRQVKSGESTSYTVSKKVVEVTDLWALVKAVNKGSLSVECLLPNIKVLQAMVDGGVEKIPGCTITTETSLRTRGG